MAVMATTRNTAIAKMTEPFHRRATRPARGHNHDPANAGLWPLGTGPAQFGSLHFLRLQLLQTGDRQRLAVPRRLQRFRHGPLRGDVWFSPVHLRAVGLAAEP